MKLSRHITERLEVIRAATMFESLASKDLRYSVGAVGSQDQLDAASPLVSPEYCRNNLISHLHYEQR